MTGAITGAIMGGIQGGINPTYCFKAGTPVVTENGSVAIEDIAVGDRVLSYDYVTGEQSYQTVTATSIRQTNELVALSVGGEQIITTPRHPFYVVNDDTYHGYTAAEYLSAGDCILTADGNYAVIESVEKQPLADPIDVYNFTVEKNHSYYVGETELLVHNYSCSLQYSNNAQDAVKNARLTRNGKVKGTTHVYNDHRLGSQVDRYGKEITTRFNTMSKNKIDDWIDATIPASPNTAIYDGTWMGQGRNNRGIFQVFRKYFTEPTGYDEEGVILKGVEVLLGQNGNVISAYPVY